MVTSFSIRKHCQFEVVATGHSLTFICIYCKRVFDTDEVQIEILSDTECPELANPDVPPRIIYIEDEEEEEDTLPAATVSDTGVIFDEVDNRNNCPGILARHIASKCSNYETVLNPYCGTGSNAIQLALDNHEVIVVDYNREDIKLTKKNARICGVADRISFIESDYDEIGTQLTVDAIVTSPYWGKSAEDEDELEAEIAFLLPAHVDTEDLLEIARNTTARVVVLNVDKDFDIDGCLIKAYRKGFDIIRIERISIDNREQFITVYLEPNMDDRDANVNSLTVRVVKVHLKTSRAEVPSPVPELEHLTLGSG